MATTKRPRKKIAVLVAAGRKGGLAKVPKGFAKMNPKKRSAAAKAAALKRWGKPS